LYSLNIGLVTSLNYIQMLCCLGSLSASDFLRRYYCTKTLSWEQGSSVEFWTEPV